jgi:hypothetical protein
MTTFNDIEINDIAKLAETINIDFNKLYQSMKQVVIENH